MRRWPLVLLLAACGDPGAGGLLVDGGDTQLQGLLQSTLPDGSVGFVRRIDGSIEEMFKAAVTEARSQIVVLTTRAAGLDQGKVLILGEDGYELAQYKTPGATPWPGPLQRTPGELFRQVTSPHRGQTIPFQRMGRRFLLVGAQGDWGSSPVSLLEVVARDRLIEHFVFWNAGHVHTILLKDPWLVLAGVSNALAEDGIDYVPILAIFRLDDIIDGPPRGESPGKDGGETVDGAPYRFYLRMDPDGDQGTQWFAPRLKGNVLHARTPGDLVYRIQLETGEMELIPSRLYRSEYEQFRRKEIGLLLEEHLARLRDLVRVWTPGPPE